MLAIVYQLHAKLRFLHLL